MLTKELTLLWNSGKFAPACIINTQNPESALIEISRFAEKIMGMPNLPIENNPDFYVIKREPVNSGENLTKHITVNQIRELQKFFSTTNITSPYKIAVIYEADNMNLNASNCCLKILEDTPDCGYIFLITSTLGNIISTIKSRCTIIKDSIYALGFNENSYLDTLEILQDNQVFLSKLSAKIDRETFHTASFNLLYLLGKIIKKSQLTNEEEACARFIVYNHYRQLLHKYDSIKRLTKETYEFDLDLRTSFVLIFETILNK